MSKLQPSSSRKLSQVLLFLPYVNRLVEFVTFSAKAYLAYTAHRTLVTTLFLIRSAFYSQYAMNSLTLTLLPPLPFLHLGLGLAARLNGIPPACA